MGTVKRWKYAIVMGSMAMLLAASAYMVTRMGGPDGRYPQSVSSEAPTTESATPAH